MENINNNINKFDGKYLKCIISKYKAVTDYLANSGSMIILQPGGDNINRNYMYLGDEFIASGYGFSTESKQRTAEKIVNEYYNTINELKAADKNEAELRKQKDDELDTNINKCVKIDKGPIDETIFRLNNYNIPTKDIILYGEEARYDNLEVKHVEIYVHGTYFNHNQDCIDVYANYKDNVILCPIGSRIKCIDINIETLDNDSGGLKKLVVYHNKDITEYSGDNDIEAVVINYDYDNDYNITLISQNNDSYDYIINDEININYSSHKWCYTKELNNEYVLRGYLQNAIKNICLYVKATPESAYKYYPGLLQKGFKVISSGNAIKENKIDLNRSLDIKPQYYIRYNINEPFSSNNFYNTSVNILPLNNFTAYDKSDITINININSSITREIYIAIPNNFVLHKIYLIDNHNQKYNWTGAVNIVNNICMPCAYSEQNSNESWPCLYYNIYSLICDTHFTENVYELNIIVIYNNEDLNVIDKYPNEIPGNGNNGNSINDEEFNKLYWIPWNSERDDISKLTTLLDAACENGVQH